MSDLAGAARVVTRQRSHAAISPAVQEGARAYLNRQYTTIGGVGVVLFVVLIPIQNIRVAIGFPIGGAALGGR